MTAKITYKGSGEKVFERVFIDQQKQNFEKIISPYSDEIDRYNGEVIITFDENLQAKIDLVNLPEELIQRIRLALIQD